MTGEKPIYFEGGCIKLFSEKKVTKYELKIWLNQFNYVTLETGVWCNNKDELVNKVSKVRDQLRQEFADNTSECPKCHKPMIPIGNNRVCFKCRVLENKSTIQKQGMVTQ